jgi:sulfur carrier protein ThiS
LTFAEIEEMGVVTVKMFHVRDDDSPLEVALQNGMTLEDLIKSLKLPQEPEAVIVNGTYVAQDYQLQNGDRVTILPFLSGG